MSVFADRREERRALLALLVDGEHPIELRYRVSDDEWRKAWATTPADGDEQAGRLTALGYDVFVGLLPRFGRTRDAQRRYAPGCVLWADGDSARASRKLLMFEPTPTAVVRSGGVDDGEPKRHGYWLLDAPLSPGDIRRHVLRLARHLEADVASCDPARVLRVPGSRSHKTGRVARLESFTGEAHALADVTGGLEDSPRYVPDGTRRPAKSTDELVALFAGRYGEGERHDLFRSVSGVLLRRCLNVMPAEALREIACCWAKEHTRPCKDRSELERQFDNLLARELARRPRFADFVERWSSDPTEEVTR